jgi:hypothetical protein
MGGNYHFQKMMDHTNMSAHTYEATNHKEGTDTSPTTTMGLQNISTKEELLYGQPPKFLTRPSLDNSTRGPIITFNSHAPKSPLRKA